MKMLNSSLSTLRYARLLAITAALVWVFSSGNTPAMAQATPTRIGVVDTEKVLTQSTAGKGALAQLKKLQEGLEQKGNQMVTEVKQLQAELQNGPASMSQSKLAEMTKQLDDKKAALQGYQEKAQKELAKARDQTLGELDKKITPVISAVGKEMGLAAVFRKFESGLLYADDSIDITDKVIARVDGSNP